MTKPGYRILTQKDCVIGKEVIFWGLEGLAHPARGTRVKIVDIGRDIIHIHPNLIPNNGTNMWVMDAFIIPDIFNSLCTLVKSLQSNS